MKRLLISLVLLAMVLTFSSCAETTVKGSVVGESANGNAVLDIMPQKIMENIEIGDTVFVTIGDFSEEMPFVDEPIAKEGKLQLVFDAENGSVNVCIFNKNFCDTYDVEIGEKVVISKK